MNEKLEPSATVFHLPARNGLAIASLVLGILACVLSLFVVGGILGVIGILLGMVHVLQKRGPRAMAWWGIGLSGASLVASAGLLLVYVSFARQIAQTSAADSSRVFSAWQGVTAPDLTVKTIDGQSIALRDLRGKRVIVDFWATWCGPCVKEIPHLTRLYSETSRDELEIVGISDENESTIRSFTEEKGIRYVVGRLVSRPPPYRYIRAIPTTFFIDRNGVIQSVTVGYRDFDSLKSLALASDYDGPQKPAPAEEQRTP